MKERNKYRKEAIEFFNSDSRNKMKEKNIKETNQTLTSWVETENLEDLITDQIISETKDEKDTALKGLLLKHQISSELE